MSIPRGPTNPPTSAVAPNLQQSYLKLLMPQGSTPFSNRTQATNTFAASGSSIVSRVPQSEKPPTRQIPVGNETSSMQRSRGDSGRPANPASSEKYSSAELDATTSSAATMQKVMEKSKFANVGSASISSASRLGEKTQPGAVVKDTPSRNLEKSSLATAGSTTLSTQASSIPRSREHSSIGLRNLGNTCFMNSILQCVFHTPRFLDSLMHSDINRRWKLRGQLAERFCELMQAMRSSRSSCVSPDDVKTMIGRFAPQFNGYSQQDAHEFLRFLLDGLHEDVNRVQNKEPYRELKGGTDYKQVAAEWFEYNKRRDDSVVMDYFRGQLLSLIACSKCNTKSAACDTFMDLSIPVPARAATVSLESCLDEFIAETEVDGYKCESCGKTSRSRMEMTIWRCPQILVIHLKRFANSSWRRQKIETEVRFPVERFSMSQYCRRSTDPSAQSPVYSLFGVSHHMGDLGFGHYVA